ncbi:MAG: hypothetical protein HY897_05920 [Deltaproteobacteria bacterium]|nr:hypothetical protein [Deltaproteobacteria bacterium]
MKNPDAIVLALLLLCCACGGGGSSADAAGPGADAGKPADDGGAPDSDAGPDVGTDAGVVDNREDCRSTVVASYGPGDRFPRDFYPQVYPFPNGFYTTPDPSSPTGLRLDYPEETMPLDMNERNGFGTFGFLMEKFYTTGRKYEGKRVSIDTSTIPATPEASAQPGSTFFLAAVDDLLDNTAAEFETFAVPLDFMVNQSTGTAFARNRRILRENTDYVFVVTKGIKVDVVETDGTALEQGLCVAAADNFRAVRSPEPIESGSAFGSLEALRASLQPVFERLEQAYALPRKEIAVLSVFRTGVNRSEVASLRAIAEAQERFDTTIAGAVVPADADNVMTDGYRKYVPCIEDDIVVEQFDVTAIETMVTGTFKARQFCCKDDRFNRDPATGAYSPHGDEALEFVLYIPKARPADGIVPPFPIIVFHHAFQVCKESAVGIAGELARFGFATASFDMVLHGSRAHQPACADGRLFCDTKAETFIKPGDMSATVAYLEQTLLDDLAFAKMLKGLSVDVQPVSADDSGNVDLAASGDGVPDIDPSMPFGFVSQSLGSYLGVGAIALEPHYDRAVVNVGLGAFYKFIVEGIFQKPDAEMNMLDEATAGYIAGIQTICDRVEAMNFAPMLVAEPAGGRAPLNLLYQAAMEDEVIPHSGTDLIAWATGLEQVDGRRIVAGMPQVASPRSGSYLGTATTAGYFQFADADHIFLLWSDILGLRESAQYQVASFLRTNTIIDPWVCGQNDVVVQSLGAKGITVRQNPWCE